MSILIILHYSIGENVKLLIDRPDGAYCFRLHNERVFYISEKLLRHAVSIHRDQLLSIGTCFGKFTKSRKFRLHITALDYLAPYAQVNIFVLLFYWKKEVFISIL